MMSLEIANGVSRISANMVLHHREEFFWIGPQKLVVRAIVLRVTHMDILFDSKDRIATQPDYRHTVQKPCREDTCYSFHRSQPSQAQISLPCPTWYIP